MECAATISDKEYLRQFNKKAFQLRIPLCGSLELTRKCNLRCVHCYVGNQFDTQKAHKYEMDTRRALSVIDEITEAGCLYLLITGGEPLLRKDFLDIYRHAKSRGLLVTVFTNGTCITEDVLLTFRELPPWSVEISLYGSSEATYEKVTCVKGSYERCLDGIQRLLDGGIKIKLKTVLMTLNRHELEDMKKMAEKYGVAFRFDAAIFPRFTGDKNPLSFRVPPDEAVEKEFLDDERKRLWREFFDNLYGLPEPDTLYICGAGITGFHIDSFGNLHPCLMPASLEYNLLTGSFQDGWNNFIPRILEKKGRVDFICRKCENKILCGYCPPFFRLEKGAEDIHSEYLCAMGRHRLEKILEQKGKGG